MNSYIPGVDELLSRDPVDAYVQSDPETRSAYLEEITSIAEKGGVGPSEVAGVLSRRVDTTSGGPRRVVSAHRVGCYLAAIATLTMATLVAVAVVLTGDGTDPFWVPVAITLFVPVAICLARDVLHSGLAMVLRPRPALPALRTDAPEALARSVCVIYPAILHDEHDVVDLARTVADGLRDSGTDRYVHLALVDFGDSPTEHAERDTTLAADLDRRLAALARADGGTTVAACYRHRRWNPAQRVWMGWERKRGKVFDFARLVAGAQDTDLRMGPDLRRRIVGTDLVITLDVGCRLPDGGAQRLVAIMSHPLNRPVVDEATGRVVAGHGLVQPASAFDFAARSSPYRIATYGYSATLDPVTAHPPGGQQLFGTGNFLGQAVFDPAVFVAALDGRIPENTVLSHDKFEGFHVRAGTAVEVALYEDPPQDYLTDRQRFHRWFRGDFHLLPWVTGRRRSPAMGALARWTMAYDLMFHLRYAVTPVLLTAIWLLAPQGAILGYTTGLLGAVCATVVLDPLVALLARIRRGRPDGFLAASRAGALRCAGEIGRAHV